MSLGLVELNAAIRQHDSENLPFLEVARPLYADAKHARADTVGVEHRVPANAFQDLTS